MEYTQNIHVAWVNFIEYMWNTLGYNFPLYPNVFHIIQHRIQYRIYYNIPDNKLPHFDNKPPCIPRTLSLSHAGNSCFTSLG